MKKQSFDVNVLKHSGRSVFVDTDSKRVSVKLLSYEDNTTVYQANMDAVGVIFDKCDDGSVLVSISRGGQTVKSMSMDEFMEKMLK